MKVSDVVTTLNVNDLVSKILGKYNNYPSGSLSPREVVTGLDYTVQNQEEAERIVKALDAHVSNAINDFQVSLRKKG
jgi:hypothetical protein